MSKFEKYLGKYYSPYKSLLQTYLIKFHWNFIKYVFTELIWTIIKEKTDNG